MVKSKRPKWESINLQCAPFEWVLEVDIPVCEQAGGKALATAVVIGSYGEV